MLGECCKKATKIREKNLLILVDLLDLRLYTVSILNKKEGMK
jgi:hypothetical protein